MRQSIHPLGDTTYHFVKANVLNSLQDKEIAALKDRIKQLEESLESANTFLQLVMCEQNQLRDVRNKANDRIKRLEEAGDALYEGWIGYGFTKDKHLAAWLKAKDSQ
jgi:DNA-binding transcriptional regulator YbjK